MFLTLYYYSFRNAEFLELMYSIHQIIVESNLETLTPLQTKFEAQTKEFEGLFKTSTKNPLTDRINEEDGFRDTYHTGFVKVVEGYTYFSDAEKSNAAKSILNTIRNHGSNITNLNLREETAVLKSLISELETTPKLSNALVLLDLLTWVEDIKRHNLNCETLLIERAEIKSSMAKLNTKDLRLTIMNTFKDITKLIEAHITLQTEGDYETIKNRINDQIKDFNATLNLRS